ncbi:hypothetical protein [Streptomyces sp. 769]|uniref:hypothetical protein n=1 Tax=Streptomyces sp. 769 TaxID=1262452 RepID=UPI00057D3274|nr:hypothetical protein [Streptomyces sp. 769]AJC54006.1 hypothetical protein GZL_01406 [Streptomyces sp. 769]
MGNAAFRWDGTSWQPAPTHAYGSSQQWEDVTSFSIWDGEEWMSALPAPVEFPTYAYGTKGNFTNVDVATLPLPKQTRLGETVVSICASYGDQEPAPPRGFGMVELLPVRATEGVTLDPTKLHLQASMFQWQPAMGRSVSWSVSGKQDTNCVVMNLVYRNADASKIPAKPIVDYRTAENVNKADLQPATDYTSLYVALALSKDLTNCAWPEGFTQKRDEHGQFAEDQVHMMIAHTVGTAASPGTLQLDSTVDELAVALITVPGMENPDKKGVWILGDAARSTLGTTTVLQ